MGLTACASSLPFTCVSQKDVIDEDEYISLPQSVVSFTSM
jgi:hypothetical protein